MIYSTSRLSCYQTCQQKYWHKYEAKTPVTNPQDFSALEFGKMFHELVEKIEKEKISYDDWFIGYKEEHKILLIPMIEVYLNWAQEQKKHEILSEVHFETDVFQGYIDQIRIDEQGNWDIIDFKTVSMFTDYDEKFESLKINQQIAMYIKHKKQLAQVINADADKFDSFKYVEIYKPKILKTKDPESKIREFIFTEKEENKIVWSNVLKTVTQIERLQENQVCKNLNSCFLYNNKCEYFDACHKKD